MSTSSGVVLLGDGIENPANALTMIHAASMFGARCRFRDMKGLAGSGVPAGLAGEMSSSITGYEIQALQIIHGSARIAKDNDSHLLALPRAVNTLLPTKTWCHSNLRQQAFFARIVCSSSAALSFAN